MRLQMHGGAFKNEWHPHAKVRAFLCMTAKHVILHTFLHVDT